MSETILYQTAMVEVGVFAVNPQEPCFLDTGFVDSPIIVFPKNSIWIQHTGSDPFVADPTLVNFYNEGQTYQRYAIDQAGDYCHWFRIDEALLSEVVAKDQRHFERENMPCPAAVFLLHLRILKHIYSPGSIDQLELEEAVLTLFTGLLTQNHDDRTFLQQNDRHKQLVEGVKESLHEDLSVNLSLQQLANIHHTSPYHLSRVFKRVNGVGINQYRKQQRIRHLILELQQHPVDLVDLAFDYGFSSHAHMSASCKQVFGLTPTQCLQDIQLS